MNEWGPSLYGDPCRECRYAWTDTVDLAVALVTSTPNRYGELLANAAGTERHPDLMWCASEYVSHVSDNLRIWAERLMGVACGASPRVASYDESQLARVRGYADIPLQAALWSLGRSVDDWVVAVGRSSPTGTVLIHLEQGELTLSDVAHANAHDAIHHKRDIERILRHAG